MSRRHDVVVVGGGPAGAAFATLLAKAGRDVVLVEREARAHDKVCGEFLSHEALSYLKALGVDPYALGAVPIRQVVLARGRISVVRKLPFEAASLSRRALDEALLRRAAEAGAAVLRGRAVRELARTADGWTARLQDGESLLADAAALACGKHDLREHVRPAGIQNDLIGLKAHFRLAEAGSDRLRETVMIGLFPGGYAGLEPIEDERANLCLLVRGDAFAALGRAWPVLLETVLKSAPDIGAVLKGAVQLHQRPLAVARIPFGLVTAESPDGCWRLGDQAAVIPSFAGEGMSLALHSARLAAEAMLHGRPAAMYQARFAADVGARVRVAAWLSKAATATPAQALAALLCRTFPSTLSALAAATRIPSGALR
ncbi:FAD-dependent monooxygenase [Chelatococcus sambhunathii]|uniref:FAD-dependent monooxygenase n=1 Tax=Chelatococcus sambhunathii TaxID=363953 RepID=A0ABU1DA97_9HYPH|nr:FAD-dependent monooxygenase [Chelatococcus sambhunathii]MDR4305026.1 FAD-dependent monooxygenase [Chelatococcus sambhunathii]